MKYKITLFYIFLCLFISVAANASDFNYSSQQKEKNLLRFKIFKAYAEAMSDEQSSSDETREAVRLLRNMRGYQKNIEQLTTLPPANTSEINSTPKETFVFSQGQQETEKVLNFLENNVTDTKMPLSFRATADYWRSLNEGLDVVEAVMERALVQNSLDIYDGAVWQMALNLCPTDKRTRLVEMHTKRLSDSRAGEIFDLRGYGPAFRYGDEEQMMDRYEGYFFRMISDQYVYDDPLGQNDVPGFPNSTRVHHEDWKPVTGEQAWAAIIAPLQIAYKKYDSQIPLDSLEFKLAVSVLRPMRAMQSPVGALYYAPEGTFGIHTKLISNENNFSAYAALGMLEKTLRRKDPASADLVLQMQSKIASYVEKYAFDRKSHQFYAGGYYMVGQIIPDKIFAADCQTWAISSLGPEWIDAHFGAGECYEIWKNTLTRASHADELGFLDGIGFASDHEVVSVEWTCGAILAARQMAEFYKTTRPEWSKTLLLQAAQLRKGIEKYKQDLPGNQTAYLYVSQRYFIPFGWWASPVPSLSSSAWVVLIDAGFNPFRLGG